MAMFQREITAELEVALRSYPIVTIVGPRQSGKTTVARHIAPNKPYYNLEQPNTRELIKDDPVGLLKQCPDGAIFDEVQHAPELLSYLQVVVDERNVEGLFILTGSHQPALHAAISQSLAGRTAMLSLLPLSINELNQQNIKMSLHEYLFNGFMPRVYDKKIDPSKYYRDYLQTYIEKDVRTLINLKDLMTFQKFLKLCASRTGQVLNLSAFGGELGVSHHTVKHWLSVLQASFVITLLPPCFENFGKRLIKSPKLYFMDVGLACYLLDIENINQLARDPARGGLVENLVISEMQKARLNCGKQPNLYYYRDSQQVEIDVIYKAGHQLIPFEIKATDTYRKAHFKSIKYFKNLVGERCEEGYLVYSGDEEILYGDFSVINFSAVAGVIKD